MATETKKEIGILILDKLVIAVIVVIVGLLLDSRLKKELQEKESKTQLELKSLDTQTQKDLRELDFNIQNQLNQSNKKLEFDMQKDLNTFSKELDSKMERESIRLSHDLQLEKERIQSILTREETLRKQTFDKEIENLRSKNSFTNDIEKIKIERKLSYIQKQLEEFYWPIYLRLEKDNAIWTLRRNKKYIGPTMDTCVVLPNHLEIVKIIEEKIYLASPDPVFLGLIAQYIKHVKIYWALRKLKIYDRDPISIRMDEDIDEDKKGISEVKSEVKGEVKKKGEDNGYPSDIYKVVKKKTIDLQNKYDDLMKAYQDIEKNVEKENGKK